MNVTEKYAEFDMAVYDLKAETVYDVYITAGNAHPGFPDLIDSK